MIRDFANLFAESYYKTSEVLRAFAFPAPGLCLTNRNFPREG
jgi:hypothetical protein